MKDSVIPFLLYTCVDTYVVSWVILEMVWACHDFSCDHVSPTLTSSNIYLSTFPKQL